jgi:DNA helicase-2/ATP-dependent DNA helicase PcrA
MKIDEDQLPRTDFEKERLLSITGQSTIEIAYNAIALEAVKQYEGLLYKAGYIDFPQIAVIATKIIQEKEYVRKTLEARYPWLLIDEYQDLGKALHEMVLAFHGQTDIKIFAVGDMNQSIYGFTGAYPDFLQEIYQYDDFRSIDLKNNYRSTQGVINASLIALDNPPPQPEYVAKNRTGEAMFTFITCEAEMSEQYLCVADRIIPHLISKGVSLKEIAVVTGYNTEASEMGTVLKEKSIPYYLVRWSFDNHSDVVQWLIDCAKWCENSLSISFDSLFSYWQKLIEIHPNKRHYWESIRLRIDFHEVLSNSKGYTSLEDWISFLFDKLQILSLLENSPRYPEEYNNLNILLKEIESKDLKNMSRLRFTSLENPEDEVTVTTRHSVKGLEFEVVILLGMEEGRFPYYKCVEGSREMKEAHRLCYVCVSRAKQSCFLLYSKITTIPTKRGGFWEKQNKVSRFWTALYDKYGTEKNTFNCKDFL